MRPIISTVLLFITLGLNAQIITEIMYNPPESGGDSLEYIEFYNNTDQALNLINYSLIGVQHTFEEDFIILPNNYFALCKDSTAMLNAFGLKVTQWKGGALNNQGEEVGLVNESGEVVFAINYDNSAPWPTTADGGGPSLELCNLQADVSDANNWNLSQERTQQLINSRRLTGSPGSRNNTICQQRDYMSLAISEVFYEQPLWDTDLQYIEFHNFGSETINLSEWSLRGDITLSIFPNIQVAPGEYFLVGNEPLALFDFGIIMPGWAPGRQIFGDPFFILTNPNGTEVAKIRYEDNEGWPKPERGYAIELCDPQLEHNQGLNWALSDNVMSESGKTFFGTPGFSNSCDSLRISSVKPQERSILSISPNPTRQFLKMETEARIYKVEILGLDGRSHLLSGETKSIDVSMMDKGSYFIRIRSSEGIHTKMFVKV